MDKKKFKIHKTAKETLDSCGMTREEFLSEMKIGDYCSGFNSVYGYQGGSCEKIQYLCKQCSINSVKTKEQIITWLNETVPEKVESPEVHFDYDRIMQKNTVVHCETTEKANKLLNWADSKGLKWCDGESYLDSTEWDKVKPIEGMCYNLFNGEWRYLSQVSGGNNYTILKYEDVLKTDKKVDLSSYKGILTHKENKPHTTLSCLTESKRYTKTEKEMKKVIKEITTLEEHKLYIEANGLSKKDIKVVTDVTDNKLYLETIANEDIIVDKDLKDLDLTIKGEWSIDKKYNVSETKSSIAKGILKIVVPVQKNRIKSIPTE